MLVVPATDLITGFKNGEQTAIKQLYSLHYRALCYFAEKLVNDKTEAEDIAIETFLKLLNKRDDFKSLADIKAFLFTATRNACFDHLRKIKRHDKSHVELQYLMEQEEALVEREMLISKVLQVLYVEVENLPGQCKKVFRSIFIENKSTAEVALEMGISTQTVLNQKAKALQALRNRLYQHGLYSAELFLYCLFLFSSDQQSMLLLK